jgi:signal peptidase II
VSSSEVSVPRSRLAFLFMLVSLVVYAAADLGTKEWALHALSAERTSDKPPICQPDERGYTRMQRVPTAEKTVIEGYFVFHYAENCGAAFGMLRTAPAWVRAVVFGVAALGATIVLSLMFIRGAGGPMFAAAVPLILSGALGNLADRIRHGFVVDFIQVDPRWFSYPTFNVADITIFIGVALLFLDGMRKPAPQPSAELERDEPAARS